MASTDPKAVFWDIHHGLPREGPGNLDSTVRALALAEPIPWGAKVLDVACGPGMQTLDLADLLPGATIRAVDLHQAFVDETNRRARSRRVADRVLAACGDMRSLDLQRETFDLIWCEGAAYMMGVGNALRSWRPLMKSGAKLALSEAVWLRPDPPEEVRLNFADYPGIRTVEACRALVRDCGYRLLGDFVLPDAAWWEYYTPLQRRLDELASKYAGDLVAEAELRNSAAEIATYRYFSAYYGYVFLVMTPHCTHTIAGASSGGCLTKILGTNTRRRISFGTDTGPLTTRIMPRQTRDVAPGCAGPSITHRG